MFKKRANFGGTKGDLCEAILVKYLETNPYGALRTKDNFVNSFGDKSIPPSIVKEGVGNALKQLKGYITVLVNNEFRADTGASFEDIKEQIVWHLHYQN